MQDTALWEVEEEDTPELWAGCGQKLSWVVVKATEIDLDA